LVDKLSTFEEAAFGISVLETALASSLSLVHEGKIELPLLVSKFTSEPASFLNSNLGTLLPGRPADITVFDPHETWKVNTSKFESKGKNTPLEGKTLKGKVKVTYYSGKKVFQSI
jgi:dihydroorotase